MPQFASIWSRKFVPAAILGVAALSIVLIWIGYAAEAANDTKRALREAEIRLEGVAQALAEQVERTLSGLNIASLYLRHAWRHNHDQFGTVVDALRPATAPAAELNVMVNDANGWMVFSTYPKPPAPVNFSERQHFLIQKNSPDDRLFVSQPVLGKLSNRLMIPNSRKLLDAQGRFAGIVVVAIPADSLFSLEPHLNLGARGAATLIGMDRVVRAAAANTPGTAPEPGTATSPDRPYFQAPDGVFQAVGSVDKADRLFAFRRLKEFPLVMVVSDTVADIEATTLPHRRELAVFALSVSTAVAVFALMLAHFVHTLSARNRALDAKSEELSQSNAELEQFAYVASHDLREPLRMISSFLTLLEKKIGAGLDQDGRDYLNFARDGAVRMDRLVLDLLEYSRIGRGRRPNAVVDLGAAMDEVRANLAAAISESGGTVEVLGRLPTVAGNAHELTRLLQNLVSNGLKYHTPGQAPHVSVSAARDGEYWMLSVADNGIGIAPEHHERVFGIFQRLHSRDRYEGTGIGLAVCKKVVERHGGRIEVLSGEGQGAVFRFTLSA